MNIRNKCGFQSIYIALCCKKSSILEKYEINNLDDFINLLVHGNEKYLSLFDTFRDNYDFFDDIGISLSSEEKNFLKKMLDYQYEILTKDNKGVISYFFTLVSIYLNIKINIIFSEDNNNNDFNKNFFLFHNDVNNFLIKNPYNIITIKLTKGHADYEPLSEEKHIYDELNKIHQKKLIYLEELSDDIYIFPNEEELEKIIDSWKDDEFISMILKNT